MKIHLLAALVILMTASLACAPAVNNVPDPASPEKEAATAEGDAETPEEAAPTEAETTEAPAEVEAATEGEVAASSDGFNDEDRSPQNLYAEFCSNCHDPGIAGAPKTGETKDWDELLKSRTFDGLVLNTIKGAGMMPVKGACVACSDKEIEEVVKFMLDKAKVEYEKK